MIRIRPIAFLDTLSFTANLRLRHWDRLKGSSRLTIHTEDGLPDFVEEWASAKALLTRMRNASAPFFGGRPAVLGDVWVEAIDADEQQPWMRMAKNEWMRIQTTLAPSPGYMLYCGGEATGVPVGQIVYVDHASPFCQANFGEIRHLNLVAHVRRPDADAAVQD